MTECSYSNPTIRNLHFISLISALFSQTLLSLFNHSFALCLDCLADEEERWSSLYNVTQRCSVLCFPQNLRICASPACRIKTLAHVLHNVQSPRVCTQIEANWLQIKSKEQKLSSCILPNTPPPSCVFSGHCAVSNTSAAGKQPLFNLHQANL